MERYGKYASFKTDSKNSKIIFMLFTFFLQSSGHSSSSSRRPQGASPPQAVCDMLFDVSQSNDMYPIQGNYNMYPINICGP